MNETEYSGQNFFWKVNQLQIRHLECLLANLTNLVLENLFASLLFSHL